MKSSPGECPSHVSHHHPPLQPPNSIAVNVLNSLVPSQHTPLFYAVINHESSGGQDIKEIELPA